MPPIDRFAAYQPGMDSTCSSSELVDISAGDYEFQHLPRAIYVGTGGNLNCQFVEDAAPRIRAVKTGATLPWRLSKVLQASTTATGIEGLGGRDTGTD